MDKYVKVKKIGEGSFGKALLVKSKVNGKQYVVKEINMQKMSPRERKEAKKETAVLAQLNHPSIVTYLESFEEIGNLYIVMDYCDGGDLYARINLQRGILFNENQILDWFSQLCLAIKHIHDRKILHRDIKSQNIFLTKSNVVKLGDFGIAKVLNSTVELARTCIGTPYYLSPEICENRPYNNKSDVWSMGCVLYELTTLKHAFEAGNMKNLVLKIIRGSYPPVPSKYSYELRNMIGALFKRNPRDRPSVNNILRKPLISGRIPRFLSESEYADEFSHTVMHGAKIKPQLPPQRGPGRELPPGPVPRPLPAKRAPPAPAKYDPKSVYGPSVAKSAVRKSKEKDNRKSSSNSRRPPSAGPGGDHREYVAMKKKELQEKERKRREEIKKKEEEYARQHRELQDKQKRARLHQAREEGWRNLVDSIGSDDSKGNDAVFPKPVNPPKSPSPGVQALLKDRDKYSEYHAYLDDLEQQKNRANMAGIAAMPGENAAKEASEAARRARRVEEFLQNKKAAALNKARGQGIGLGAAAALGKRPNVPKATPVFGQPVVQRKPTPKSKPVSNNQEQEYLNRLRQIRLQNFNDRRAIIGRMNEEKNPEQSVEELRKKKVECLRAQAEARAQKLKADLERKRKEAYEQGAMRYKQECAKAKNEDKEKNAPSRKLPSPAPVMPVTAAMQAIGAKPAHIHNSKSPEAAISMTAMMEAIGAKPKEPVPQPACLSAERSSLQQKKDDILKKLNEKPPVPDRPKWSAPVIPKMQEEAPDRPKWSAPVMPKMQEEGPERLRWAGGDGVSLGKLKLEETASQMEATGDQDKVIKNPGIVGEGEEDAPSVVSARKQWGKPAGTVVNILQEARVDSSTILLKGAHTPESASPVSSTGSVPVIARSPGKGTLVITKPGPGDQLQDEISADPNTESVTKETKSPTPTGLVTENVEEEKPVQKKSPRSSLEMKSSKERLFERVELQDEDEDENAAAADDDAKKAVADDIKVEEIEEDEEADDVNEKGDAKKTDFMQATAGVMLGLTIGHFDVGNPKVLRTCSLPDLTKVGSPALGVDDDLEPEVAMSLNLGVFDSVSDDDNPEEKEEEEKEENEEKEKTITDRKNEDDSKDESIGKEDENDEDDEDVEDEEEDDLESMRETMQSLLIDEDEPVSPLLVDSGKKKLKRRSADSEVMTSPEPESENAEEEDADKISVSASTDSLLSDTPAPTIVPGKEEWCSDEDEEADDRSVDDLFSRLEESRLELEQELGCDSFLQAYKSVQAIHEDEDENIEDCSRAVNQILGEKTHLYDKIVKLVMADGAFTEDNE